MPTLLEVKGLSTLFETKSGSLKVVDQVSLEVKPGRVLGVVGESGSGKSVMALSLLRLIAKPGRIGEGEIFFEGHDLLKLKESEVRTLRGRKIAMIFQEPMTSLNPVMTVGAQVIESLRLHEGLKQGPARLKAIELFKKVGISSPEKRIDEYPHQLSGGMRQRVMIAMAISCNPSLLIADEPTTALDVTIQAQILDLLKSLRKQQGMGMILITHDLGVVSEVADEIAVMYAGQIVEMGKVESVFGRPLHPYTQGLMASIPRLGATQARLKVIQGLVPKVSELPPGCRFQQRCEFKEKRCEGPSEPHLESDPQDPTHFFRCVRRPTRE